MEDARYCAQSSLQAGEVLAGTAAAETSAWILLEVRAPWARSAIETEALAEHRPTIEGWLQAVPGSRLQLIRQPRFSAGPLSLFLGSSRPGHEWLRRLPLETLDDLAGLDLPELFRTRGGPDADAVDAIHLVCTHGKRDRCCAKWGMGLFTGAYSIDPERVWQTTHLGGHRFAATALSLPSGLCYGRMDAADARPWMSAEGRGEIFDLAKLRGRTAYSPAVQFAEALLRQELGDSRVAALELVGVEALDDQRWRVTFAEIGGAKHVMDVARQITEAEAPGSCDDAEIRPIVNLIRG